MIVDYPHISFTKSWRITPQIAFLLGEIEGFIKSITNSPILPEDYQSLLHVALIKGAQATTAIEGNTLTEDEIVKIQEGEHLPPSKEYQEIEVKNILEAYNFLLKEVVYRNKENLISPELIKEFHKMVGQNLGKYLDAVPGQFRADNRIVGKYRCPDYNDVPELINRLCKWLLEEFHFDKGQQEVKENIIQAIVTHVYIEWIHPFGDGNGRTGRLLEYYLLLRGGNPDISTYILSNHYNLTRSEYYRQLENATKMRDLTEFIFYALQGFRDGLEHTLGVLQKSQLIITWHKYIYDTLKEQKHVQHQIYKRRRDLMIDLPIDKTYTLAELVESTPKIAKLYGNLSPKSVLRDLKDLVELELLSNEGGKYSSNVNKLRGRFLIRSKRIKSGE